MEFSSSNIKKLYIFSQKKAFLIRKNIFACLFSVHNTIKYNKFIKS